jgi:hypothetical protein
MFEYVKRESEIDQTPNYKVTSTYNSSPVPAFDAWIDPVSL